MCQDMGPRCRAALQELADSEDGPFRGAIGRKGAILVRHGFAHRIGLKTYSAGRVGVDLPDRFVAFEMTRKGRAACKALGLEIPRRQMWRYANTM